MRKKRILFCSEATFLNTGYATYTREILNYLHSTGKYELAEMASYGQNGDPRIRNIPWKFFGVIPDNNASEEEKQQYQNNTISQFGELAFEKTCLEFKPDIVCDIRDFWMMDFAERSPFRNFFKWCIMPTVDAEPQARQWIATYQSADACLSYSEWAGELLKHQSGNKINFVGCSPPSAHPAYQPIENKSELKSQFGLSANTKIVGTVMRNQRRKLYPDLFESFRKFIDTLEDSSDYFLYCHTSYPDLGWDIPELLHQYNLSSKVLFTYVCSETNKPFVSLFKGAIAQSPYTNKFGAILANVKQGLSYSNLSLIMNLFDVYIQYANSEGFGLPQVEAAACGIPIMSVDYSAMHSVVKNLEGVALKPKALYKELETGCFRAVPDNDYTAQKIKEFFELSDDQRNNISKKTRKLFLEHYRWEKSGKVWEDFFDSCDVIPDELTWKSPILLRRPSPKLENISQYSHKEQARWLILNALCDPSKINSYMESRLTRDLMYKTTTSTTGGMYFNESSAAFDGIQARSFFDFDIAYKNLINLCNRHNHWEIQRAQKFGLKI